MVAQQIRRQARNVARGRLNPGAGENPLKVAITFSDEWVFAQIQRLAVERQSSFASVVRLLCADGLAVHGVRRPRKGDVEC